MTRLTPQASRIIKELDCNDIAVALYLGVDTRTAAALIALHRKQKGDAIGDDFPQERAGAGQGDPR